VTQVLSRQSADCSLLQLSASHKDVSKYTFSECICHCGKQSYLYETWLHQMTYVRSMTTPHTSVLLYCISHSNTGFKPTCLVSQTIIMHDPTSHLATACTSNSVIYCNTAHTVSLHVVVAVVKRRRRRRHSCCCLLLLMSKNASNWNRSIPLESFHLTALDFVPKHSWWDGADCCPSCMELIVVRRRSCTEARSIVVPGVVRRRFEEVVHYKDQRLRPEQHLRCYVALWGNKRGLSVCCHYQHYCRFFLTSLTVCSYSSLGNFLDLWSRIFMGWIPFLSLWAIRNEADTCCLLIRAGLRSLWVIGTSVLGSRSK